jgi:hypothetical protein
MSLKFKWWNFPLLLFSVFALLAALWAGLLRMGWNWPLLVNSLPISHGPLMVSGFFGTLISLERAVALNKRWSYLGPLASGLGGLFMLSGIGGLLGPWLLTLGSLGLVVIFIAVLRQRSAADTWMMAAGGASWLVGNALWLSGKPVYQVVWWWAGFLVLTIAGERLELGRMLRLSDFSRRLFFGAALVFAIGLFIQFLSFDIGTRIVGFGLLGLALWLARYDIARYTVRQKGLARYIAVCLLTGYFWLAISGLAAISYGSESAGPIYDFMLHSVFVGFIFGMVFGHAPIIFPAVLGLDIRYSPIFYIPLFLLEISLLMRVTGSLAGLLWLRQWGGLLNATAILAFLPLVAPIRRKQELN